MTDPEPVYLLLGPETGMKNAFVGEIRDALKKDKEARQRAKKDRGAEDDGPDQDN